MFHKTCIIHCHPLREESHNIESAKRPLGDGHHLSALRTAARNTAITIPISRPFSLMTIRKVESTLIAREDGLSVPFAAVFRHWNHLPQQCSHDWRSSEFRLWGTRRAATQISPTL
jgi:hypothetical protein